MRFTYGTSALLIVHLRKCNPITEYEIGGACSTNGKEEKCIVSLVNQKERYNLGNLRIYGKIILKWIL
jgi:hypothetical protein